VSAAAALLAGAMAPTAARGQIHREDPRNDRAIQPPPLAAPVKRAVEAAYLTDEEAKDLRIFHGLWTEEDLDTPARRARAALLSGAWSDPSLDDPAAAPEDRAEVRLLRGELESAIETLAGVNSQRARRIRAEALEGLGRFKEADAAIEPIVSDLQRNTLRDPEDLVEGVRALAIRARLRGEPAAQYHQMMALLAHARDNLDRLYWPASLVEAQLLYDKDNRQEATEALKQVLSMNPRSARAWALFGRVAVDGFNIEGARAVADRLDELASAFGDDDASSPWGDVILTKALLRQNEPDLAAEELAPTLESFPKMREAVGLKCAIRAASYDFEETEALLDEFDELSPGSPLALHLVGAALSESRQYEEAAEYLERAVDRQPNWPAPIIELGLLEIQSGRDLRAKDALTRAVELDPFNVRARNSLRLIEELLSYDTIESEHFIIRHRPGVDRLMAEEMVAPLEEIHRRVAIPLQHEPPFKTVIELMPNHRWFAVRITGMPAIHTIAAATGPVIAMEAPKVGPDHSGEYDWERVVRHEYVHTVTLSLTENRIPHWFTEAAAVYFEQAPRDFDTARLLASALQTETLFDFQDINVAFVRPKEPTDRAQAYAQGHWMYEYIVDRFGDQAPLELMKLYAQGVREGQAFRSALGVERDVFLQDFTAWARSQVKSWGMLAEPDVRTLIFESAVSEEPWRSQSQAALTEFARRAALALAGAAAPPEDPLPLPEPTEEMVDGWLEAHPQHPDALRLKIGFMLEHSRGEPTEAIAPFLQRYAEARPVDPLPHRLLAKPRLAGATPANAIPHLEYLDAREQRAPTYAVELARRYAALRDWENAQDKIQRATQIAPFDADIRELAATIAIQRGDLADAEHHIEALTSLEPDREIHRKRLERIREMRAARGA